MIVIPAAPAAAHVSVSPAQAAQGGFAVLTFRVPNERENAATNKIQLFFPTDAPIIGATVRQVTGWTSQVVQGPLSTPATVNGTPITRAVTSVTWTAKNATNAISGSDYQEFGVSVGPLPTVDRVTFKALQTYDDGQIARWIEEPVDGQPEPESPAVVLRLTAGADGLDAHGAPLTGDTAVAAGSASVSPAPASSNTALGIAIAALVIAVAAMLIALIRRRPGAAHKDA